MVPLTGDFYFGADSIAQGMRWPVLAEDFRRCVKPCGLHERITLVEVNWSLHFVLEIYLSGPGCAGGYSNMDDLPALLVVVYREKEDIRYE